jgi:hypothetical protein
MHINWVGVCAALATFIGVWVGHVLVRVIEFNVKSIILPVIFFATLGSLLLIGSFVVDTNALSAGLGILSMTAFWDAYEFFRQEKRIIKGHAPANPENPRHQKILATHSTATTLDLLKRDPIGRKVEAEEAKQLILAYEENQ